MGVRNLLNLPLAEQKKLLRQPFQTANRRIKSLEKLELTPTALRHVQSAGLKNSVWAFPKRRFADSMQFSKISSLKSLVQFPELSQSRRRSLRMRH